MAKGKRTALTTCNKPEDTRQHKTGTKKGTKENKPEMNGDNPCKGQSTIKSLWSPSKPRSPLSDNSSVLVQEGNVSDQSHADSSQRKKERPRETTCDIHATKETTCDIHATKEEPSGRTSLVPASSEPIAERLHKEDVSYTDPRPALDSVSAPKAESGTGRKAAVKNYFPSFSRTENKASQNRKVTDYYPIRRSSRKTKAELKNQEHKYIDDLIKKGVEKGLQVKHIEGKGRGVFAVNDFKRGEFVVEYHGNLMFLAEAKEKEALYAQDPGAGCYMYYFQYHGKTYCVDATRESRRLGRLINHSKNGNLQTRLHGIDGTPHLILVAARDIDAEEELLYDYGDRSKSSISAHPWLKY